MARRSPWAAGPACCTARSARCSRTTTGRSPRRTRSRPASTTRAAGPSTRSCVTPAAPATRPSPTTRPSRRSWSSRPSRASSRRSSPPTRSRGCSSRKPTPPTQTSTSSACRAAATRTSPRSLPAATDRIADAFASHGKAAALMPYLMGGFPTLEASRAIGEAYLDNGADLLELGVPYSDPLADGPVVQAAGTQALRAGATLDGVLGVGEALGRRAPVVLMAYTNLILARGVERLGGGLAARGVAGLCPPPPPARGGRRGARGLRRGGCRTRPARRADHARRAPRRDRGARPRVRLHGVGHRRHRRAHGAGRALRRRRRARGGAHGRARRAGLRHLDARAGAPGRRGGRRRDHRRLPARARGGGARRPRRRGRPGRGRARRRVEALGSAPADGTRRGRHLRPLHLDRPVVDRGQGAGRDDPRPAHRDPRRGGEDARGAPAEPVAGVTRRAAAVLLAAIALLAGGCRDSANSTSTGGDTVTAYSLLPLQGSTRIAARDLVDGEKLALTQAHGQVGPLTVNFRSVDSSEAGRVTPPSAARAARTVAQDTTAIAAIGTLEAREAAVAVPLLNEASVGLLSPNVTAPAIDSPQLYPSGQ